jgi:hypothetical protein
MGLGVHYQVHYQFTTEKVHYRTQPFLILTPEEVSAAFIDSSLD